VPVDQVDGILKSLVAYGDGGTAGEVALPGCESLTQSFVDLPFDRAALDSVPTLVNFRQGAELRVTGAKPMSGRLSHDRRASSVCNGGARFEHRRRGPVAGFHPTNRRSAPLAEKAGHTAVNQRPAAWPVRSLGDRRLGEAGEPGGVTFPPKTTSQP
jgi:hypothetical protein